ncbi:MAG: SPOR domain-containing protein [Muribaculaceae bacterium]|nr:SPOR domain-containing protein [Muribaculaceae bacterium]
MSLLRNTVLAASAVVLALQAQGAEPGCAIVDSINASGTITVMQPDALVRLLSGNGAATETSAVESDTEATQHSAVARTGYRVQVYDDNNPRTARRNAEAYNARISTEFPHIKTYISFNSPYWRVKAGDFRTRAEAEAAMAEIRRAFPALGAYLRIIRDRINTTD